MEQRRIVWQEWLRQSPLEARYYLSSDLKRKWLLRIQEVLLELQPLGPSHLEVRELDQQQVELLYQSLGSPVHPTLTLERFLMMVQRLIYCLNQIFSQKILLAQLLSLLVILRLLCLVNHPLTHLYDNPWSL